MVSRHCGDISVTAWKDVKVTTVSTFHDNGVVQGHRAGEAVIKPSVVEEYNRFMGGVDLKDQKLSMFLMERKRGVKWYIKVYKRLLNTGWRNKTCILHHLFLRGRRGEGEGRPISLGSAVHEVLVTMSHFDGKRRAFCVRAFYENSRSYVVVRRLFCSEYGVRQIREAPSANLIKIWIKRFEETGSTSKPHAKGRPRTSRTEDNIESVKQSVREDPQMSTRKRSSVLNISRRSLQRILNLDLKLHPYKLQLTQELKDSDFIARLTFANEILNRF